MSRAAEKFNIALSAASRRVALLEAQAGTPLIVRRPHGIEPTAAGITTMNYAREVLRLGEKLQTSLEEHKSGVRGYVRVSASSSVLVQRLAQRLSRFVVEYPEIKLDLEERPSAATIDAVMNKQADLGVIVRDNDHGLQGLSLIDYAGDRLAVAVPATHALASRRKLTFADILDQDLVCLESGTAVDRLLLSQAREIGRTMKVRVQVRSFEVMCLMISQGLGIGVLPERALQPLTEAMGIKLVRLAEVWARREYAICVRSYDELESPSRRLIEFLVADRLPSPDNRPTTKKRGTRALQK
jgi:DNA-binding transcriptional LysR family regulator